MEIVEKKCSPIINVAAISRNLDLKAMFNESAICSTQLKIAIFLKIGFFGHCYRPYSAQNFFRYHGLKNTSSNKKKIENESGILSFFGVHFSSIGIARVDSQVGS